MAHGFAIGIGIGVASAWLLNWRLVRLFFRLGFSQPSLRRDVFAKFSYDALVKTREQLETEFSRRERPS